MTKKINITLLSLFAISAIAIASSQEPEFPGLESNERYVSLKAQNTRLLEKEDSIQLVIGAAREEFNKQRATDSIATPEELDRFTSRILELEEKIFELRQQRGDVITELNNIEQEYILAHMYSTECSQEEEHSATEEVIEEPMVELPVQFRELIKNDIFRASLSAEDYAELEVAEREDEEIMSLCNEFNGVYEQLANTARLYRETPTESVADSLFNVYTKLKARTRELNNAIDSQWTHIVDTKYYAYGYVLEKYNHYDLLDSSSIKFAESQQRCTEEDGIYASDALMHYAIGYPTLLDFEIAIAQELGLSEAQEALQQARQSVVMPDYRKEDIDVERRLFIDYMPITLGRTNFYHSGNPIPELKVYERGTIYRLLLGTFRTKQPMTLFKGVQPLYITQNEENLYLYYAGGFATLKEAEEAQLFLKEKGFKQPEICRWRDGDMINIDAISEESNESDVTPLVGHRYLVVLECESIDDALRATISATAPEKMISRRGTQFAIGTFTDHAEADALLTTIEEKHPEVTASIVELDF